MKCCGVICGTDCYEVLCLLSVVLIVTPHPVSGTSATAQGIDSGTLGEASFWFLYQVHYLEGLLCSATGSSEKLRPRGLQNTS
jgi:hypothetical protein